MNPHNLSVKGLPFPPKFAELFGRGLWKNPGNEIIQKAIPIFKEPLIFCDALEFIEHESKRPWLDDTTNSSEYTHTFEDKGSRNPQANELPWLDAEKSFFIAVNKWPGYDLAIALDYRISKERPRVVGNNWHSPIPGSPWELICPTFEDLLTLLGMDEL